MKKKTKLIELHVLKFLVLNFMAFLIIEHAVFRWLGWWTYGSFWTVGTVGVLGFSLIVYIGWLLWFILTLALMKWSGIKVKF